MLKRFFLWLGILGGLVLLVYGLAKLGASSGPATGDALLQTPVSVEDHTKGSTIAKTVLVEYSDFQCPACRAYYPIMKQLEKAYGNSVLFVYRHFPLAQHQYSKLAAQAAEAAGSQGKFWEMHDLLFENQAVWSAAKDPRSLFVAYAQSLQLDAALFTKTLDSSEIQNRVERDLDSGIKSGVNSTPTFYLNGQELNLSTYDHLETALKQALGTK